MALNKRDDLGIWRSITIGKLRDLLTVLPADRHVVVNPTGNLSVMRGELGCEADWVMEGFVDISGEDYEAV